MAVAETANLLVKLNLGGNFGTQIAKATSQLKGFEGRASRVGKGAGQLAGGLARVGTIGVVAVGGALAYAAKQAIDFEDAFAGVKKTVEATPEELANLNDQFRELARRIPIAATEFARIGETAGALGIHVSAIDEFAEVVGKLGVTTDLTADAAADALGRIGNVMKLTADDFDNFGSALVNLGNKGASTESEIIEITKRFAAAGKIAGLSAQEILGFAEATASFTGLNPEAAGTALSKFSRILTKVTAGGGKNLKTLNKIAGTDFRKAFDKDAGGALVAFLRGLGKLDKYRRAEVLADLGLDAGYASQLLGGLSENVDGLETSLRNADEGWRGNFLNEEAAKKFDTTAQKIVLLKNNLIDAAIELGNGMGPAIGRAAEKLTAFLQQEEGRKQLRELGQDIGRFIDNIDWAQVVEGGKTIVSILRVAGDMALRLLGVIGKLPKEVLAVGGGAVLLNKLSGGLLGAGAGNILGGLLGGAVKNALSTLPVFGAAFVQRVFVTNWTGMPGGGPGGGGGGGGLLSKIMKLAVPAIGGLFVASLWKSVFQDPQLTGQTDSNTANALKMIADGRSNAELVNALAGAEEGTRLLTNGGWAQPVVDALYGAQIQANKDTAQAIRDALAERGVTHPGKFTDDQTRPTAQQFNVPGGHGVPVALAPPTLTSVKDSFDRAIVPTTSAVTSLQGKITDDLLATQSAVTTSGNNVRGSVLAGATQAASAALSGAASIVGALYANRPVVNVNVSPTTISHTTNVMNRYGSTGGSRNENPSVGNWVP